MNCVRRWPWSRPTLNCWQSSMIRKKRQRTVERMARTVRDMEALVETLLILARRDRVQAVLVGGGVE